MILAFAEKGLYKLPEWLVQGGGFVGNGTHPVFPGAGWNTRRAIFSNETNVRKIK